MLSFVEALLGCSSDKKIIVSHKVYPPMRHKVTKQKLQQFMQAIGTSAKSKGTICLTGGSCALLLREKHTY